jgi:predicted aspartyl protease
VLVIPTLLPLHGNCSQPNAAFPGAEEGHAVTQSPIRLPFRLDRGYLVTVEGSIGSIERLHFLVDTGAYPSVVDSRIARSLKLSEESGRVNLFSKTVQTRVVVLPSLLLGPLHAQDLAVMAQDLSFFEKTLGYRIDAIVGLDVLRKSSFSINYRTKEMIFGLPESLSSSAPFETEAPVVTVRMEIQNHALRLVVDTGCPDLTLFQSRVSDLPALQSLGTEKVTDASGTVWRRKVRIPEAYFGSEWIAAQTGFVIDDRKDEGDNFDGVLGARGAQFWKIAFDFEHRKFSWEH